MTASDIEAIVQGRHGDAFRILGPHVIRAKRGAPRWEVCAFVPHASAVSVVVNGQATPMGRLHTDGLFITTLDGEPAPYRLRIQDPEGNASGLAGGGPQAGDVP